MDQQPYPQLEQRHGMKRGGSPLLYVAFMLLGIVVGGLLVNAALKRQPVASAKVAQATVPKAEATVAPTIAPPVPSKVEPAKPAPTTPKVDSKKPTEATPTPGAKPITSPLSPFDGIIGISPDHPKGWGGGAPDPKIEAKVADAPPTSLRLVEMLVPESAKDRISGIAKGNSITDYRGSTFAPADGVLIYCPPKSTQGLLDKISRVGGTVGVEWSGTSSERDQIAVQHAANALQELERKRADLLVRYYEDAIPVRDVDDKIASAKAAIRQYHHKDSARLDAIKVIFIKG